MITINHHEFAGYRFLNIPNTGKRRIDDCFEALTAMDIECEIVFGDMVRIAEGEYAGFYDAYTDLETGKYYLLQDKG